LAIDLPAQILVGRTLSAYSLSDVQNNQLKLTYSVYNQREISIDAVRLTDTLKTGVTFVQGSLIPSQNGQDLSWSLGTIPAYGRASVEITVSLAIGNQLQLESFRYGRCNECLRRCAAGHTAKFPDHRRGARSDSRRECH
jgi:uncharacterized repeat protein (TIGR01451 family)